MCFKESYPDKATAVMVETRWRQRCADKESLMRYVRRKHVKGGKLKHRTLKRIYPTDLSRIDTYCCGKCGKWHLGTRYDKKVEYDEKGNAKPSIQGHD